MCQGRVLVNTKVGSLTEVGDKIEATFEGPGEFGHQQYRSRLGQHRTPPSHGRFGTGKHAGPSQRAGLRRRATPNSGPPIRTFWPSATSRVTRCWLTKRLTKAVWPPKSIAGKPAAFDKAAIPAVVFTDPEIAWAGITEEEAKREGRQVDVEVYPWAASGRAQALGITDGLTKWLIDPETNRVVGCGIVGSGAGELIAEAVLAIEMGCEVHDITESVHPHPTLSETLMNAGEVHFGTATEIYKPKKKPAPATA